MEDEVRIRLEKHFDEIVNLLDGEDDNRLDAAIVAVKETGEQVSESFSKSDLLSATGKSLIIVCTFSGMRVAI
jgi:hypothetical protein